MAKKLVAYFSASGTTKKTAEMIAATSGIGFRINDARSLMQYPIVFAGIIAIAVVGVIMDLAISLIGKLCTPWERSR